ncbi:hypothetical protein [Botrimarina sp.]|uniref:helix-turn-helix transcriptional regulator n=1 Tax=Botrimarina sp. TaxID=2795802 RepID=UPI0032EE68E2
MRNASLPDAMTAPAKFLDANGCATRYLCSTAHWRRQVDAGKAPAPRRFGRLVRWLESELDEWDAAGNPPVRSTKGGR